MRKLELPKGASEGSILDFTYPGGDDPGTYDGRVLRIKGPRVNVLFTYANNPELPKEQVVINLETGMDETNKIVVSDIEWSER